MKKKLFLSALVVCLLLVFLLTGCELFGGSSDEDKKEYKVIFVSTSLDPAPIVDGVITMPKNPTKEGYDFAGWYVDSACTIPFDQNYLSTHTITSDIRVYPKWIEKGTNAVKITLEVNGGDELLENVVTITKGMNVAQELGVPTRGGYVFVGWYTAPNGGVQMTDESGEIINYNGNDATFYAIWEATTYDVVVSSSVDAIGTVGGGKVNAMYRETITITATTLNDNYQFIGWFEGDELFSSEATYQFKVERDVTLVAKWVGEERTILFYRNYVSDDDTFVEKTYNYGETITYTPSRRAGYTFIGWYDNRECVGAPVCVNGTFENATYPNNTTLYAKWSEGHDQLEYEHIVGTNEVKLVGVKDGAGAIIHIPTKWSGYDVTTIGANVFANSNKNAIVIPSSIDTIEANAFSGATASIYFDKGADVSLISNAHFTDAQKIYVHLMLEEEVGGLIDGEYVEANGILADTFIDTREEGRAFYSYCWLYTYEEPFTLTISDALYNGSEDGFAEAMIDEGGLFKNVNLELGLKSETESTFNYSVRSSKNEITFDFSKKGGGNTIASGYTDGGKLQTQSKGLIDIKNVGVAHDFEIDSMPEYVVYNSEQLVYAVEHGYKPIFGTSGTSAENCYNLARTALTRIINPEMNVFQKVTAIHDYIALTVTYDSALLTLSTAEGVDAGDVSHYRGFNLEGVFEDGKAVCDGITKAFMLMCRIEGIEVIRVSGKSVSWNSDLGRYVEVGHAWNKVHVDEIWYTVDVTNDDSILKLNGVEYEVLNHQFFMVSDDKIATSHVEDTFIELPVSTGNYNYHKNNTYDGTRDLVITSQVELEHVITYLKALQNEIDTFYTVEVILEGVSADALDFSAGLAGFGYVPKYQIGNSGIYLVNFLKD